MNFLAPTAFWFAAAIPVVVVFYLLKRKRVVKLVSSTLLWQKFLAETQANAPFQKLRHNWLLLLQLLLLILAILALSRPYFVGDTESSALRVVILDASASMQSTDESPSRFEKARTAALKLVDGLRDEDQMIVLQAGGTTEVKQSATSNKGALRRAMQSCAATDSPTRLKEALKLASTLTRDQPDAEIHLFSDGAVNDFSEFENRGMNVLYHRVGVRSENVGVIALDIRSNPENARERAVYTSIQNFSTNEHEVELELRFENQLLEVRPLKLKPNETSPQIFFAEQSINGVFTINLKADDDLSADNAASIFSELPQPVKVLLVSRGNRFLEKALRAAPNVELSVSSDVSSVHNAFDLTVIDDVFPSQWPEGNVLAIHVVNTNWFGANGNVENPAIVDWKSTHSLLRHVNFDNVQVGETLAVKTPDWAVPLVDAQQTPLILAGELDRRKILWIGFDTLQSTWPLRISFPIFIANAVEFLNPVSAKNDQLFIRAGEPFRFPLAENIENAEIILPDGRSKRLVVDNSTREIVFGDTTKQGIYRLKLGTNETAFCVNLLDVAESNTKPRAEVQLGRYVKVEATTLKRANMKLWRWIAGTALAVLLFEWWFYHRRTA